ncbi:hypothetical protein EMIHUDRAFT_204829 [Emiliania huxleyi CCMP1516]|uniref:Uncharacterized protein n=2 Tax=Emiliania huxleyi TaxID=2903 RepID=A0A0D3JWF3_EMIH1|nr:hypothetical protein EMIHUDRAFT_204829 [Emiliania huxleyi CCMP1516]EOD27838.1 hypothetical protein EMIHUDRAFT_204829 [Emiliania huxleyi CCMP1516]|eukprot:XP_005780267.1 hypothetical protein EMIHUDRAFT_204829 [Emiliania huxleyi CCMP1516]
MSKGDSSTPTPLHGDGTATSTPPLDAPLRASARWRQLRYARRIRSTRRGGDQRVITEDGATFLASSKAWASWSYALFLSGVTFDFLLILEYRDDFQFGVYRVVMILVGALIGMVVTALPPGILGSREIRGILADNLLDAAQAMNSVVGPFCSGSRLARISQICDDPEIEWDIPATYQQIIMLGPGYEAAVSAAEWEEWELGGGGDWATFRDVGTHMRRFIYSVVTLDEYTRHPVNGSAGASRTHFSELLAGPLTDLTAAVAKLLRAIAATVEHGQGSGREATSRLNCGWPVFREAPPGRPSRRGNTEEASAAAGVERASAALAQQLAQFCRAAMAGLPTEETLWLATYIAFVRQATDAAGRLLQLHRSTERAVRRIGGGSAAQGVESVHGGDVCVVQVRSDDDDGYNEAAAVR